MKNTDLIIISDLHLSASYNPDTNRFYIKEGFHYDQVFSSFIDHLIFQSGQNFRSSRLLILGDFLDFFHTDIEVTDKRHFIPSTSDKTIQKKIEAILDGHVIFFQAFHRFLSSGFSIDIVPGNHDVELLRPSSQEYFHQALVQKFGQINPGQLTFFPWIYYIPDVLYAEHGHLYHDINAPERLLAPYCNQNSDEIDIPLGAHYDLYLSHLLEKVSLPVQEMRSPLRYLLSFYLKHPVHVIKELPIHFRFVVNILSRFIHRLLPGYKKNRSIYRDEHIAQYAKQSELPYHVLLAIDDLAALSYGGMFSRLVSKIRKTSSHEVGSDYLFEAASQIHRYLTSHHQPALNYVFGHSHHPVAIAFTKHKVISSFYFNTGTWSSPTYPGTVENKSKFPFVCLSLGESGTQMDARLMMWVDPLQKIEFHSR